MADTYFLPDEQGNTTRPELIGSLGVLSFINTGLFMVVYGLGMLAMLAVRTMPVEEYSALMLESASWLPEESQVAMEEMSVLLHESGVLLMFLLFLRTVLRFIGVRGMWVGRRWGFHVYAFAQLAGIFAPHLVLPLSQLGFFAPLLSVATTAIYGTQLKRLS